MLIQRHFHELPIPETNSLHKRIQFIWNIYINSSLYTAKLCHNQSCLRASFGRTHYDVVRTKCAHDLHTKHATVERLFHNTRAFSYKCLIIKIIHSACSLGLYYLIRRVYRVGRIWMKFMPDYQANSAEFLLRI